MKIGYLFPGQGAQCVGMGKDLYEKYDLVKETYKKVKEITGIDVAKISFEGNEEELGKTQNTQIAILTMSLSILKLLEKNEIKAEVASGLSLGEYTALINSSAISFEDGVKIVEKRGEYMQNLVPSGEWAMAAILGMEEQQVEEVCEKACNNEENFVVPVNFNCTGQIVVSGNKSGVEEAETIAKQLGAKKVRILKTFGPFHTEKLIEASSKLREELKKLEIHQFKNKVIKNIDGTVYTQKDNIKEILAKHIISPVRFSKGLETMLEMGVDTFIEIGPGKTLSGFVKRMNTDKQINILNINSVETLENTINFIRRLENE